MVVRVEEGARSKQRLPERSTKRTRQRPVPHQQFEDWGVGACQAREPCGTDVRERPRVREGQVAQNEWRELGVLEQSRGDALVRDQAHV